MDADFLCVLKARRSDVKAIFGGLASALPHDASVRIKSAGGGCLLLGHRICTPKGLVSMEELRPAMELISYLADGSPVTTRVIRTYSTRETECVIINRTIMVTSSQSLFGETNQPIHARDLESGMSLRAPNGRLFLIESIEGIQRHLEVVTLTTDHPTHNFACPELVYGNVYFK